MVVTLSHGLYSALKNATLFNYFLVQTTIQVGDAKGQQSRTKPRAIRMSVIKGKGPRAYLHGCLNMRRPHEVDFQYV